MKDHLGELILGGIFAAVPSIAVALQGGAPENLTFIGAGVAAALAVLYNVWKRQKTGDHVFVAPAFVLLATFFCGAFGPKAAMDIAYGMEKTIWGWKVEPSHVTGDIWCVLGAVFGIVFGAITELLFWLLGLVIEAFKPLAQLILRRITKKGENLIRTKFEDPESPAAQMRPRVKMQVDGTTPAPDGTLHAARSRERD